MAAQSLQAPFEAYGFQMATKLHGTARSLSNVHFIMLDLPYAPSRSINLARDHLLGATTIPIDRTYAVTDLYARIVAT